MISNYLIAAVSVAIGYLASYLYVNYYFTAVSFSSVIMGLLFYLVWVLFIVSFTTMISTIVNSQVVIALLSIMFLIGCRVIVGLSPIVDQINRASMIKLAIETLIKGSASSNAIRRRIIVCSCSMCQL